MSAQGYDAGDGGLGEALGEALAAMLHALVLLFMFALTVLARALQAVFTLARPALLLGCVVTLCYGAAVWFPVVFKLLGADVPAFLMAALSVVAIPGALVALAGDYGFFPVALLSGGLMLVAREAAIRSPPVILPLSMPVVIGAVFLYFANQERKSEPDEEIGPG